jgi:hypothetical protein
LRGAGASCPFPSGWDRSRRSPPGSCSTRPRLRHAPGWSRRFTRLAVSSLDLERDRLLTIDVVAREVGGIEEVRPLVENRPPLLRRLIRHREHLVVRLAGRDRDGHGVDLSRQRHRLEGQAVLLGQRRRKHLSREVATLDEDFAKATIGVRPLLGECLFEGGIGEEAVLDQERAERAPGSPVPRARRRARRGRASMWCLRLDADQRSQLDPVLLGHVRASAAAVMWP